MGEFFSVSEPLAPRLQDKQMHMLTQGLAQKKA